MTYEDYLQVAAIVGFQPEVGLTPLQLCDVYLGHDLGDIRSDVRIMTGEAAPPPSGMHLQLDHQAATGDGGDGGGGGGGGGVSVSELSTPVVPTAATFSPGTYKALSRSATTPELEYDPEAPVIVHRFAADDGEATVMFLKAVITAFPCVSLPFLAVPLLSQPTVAIIAELVEIGATSFGQQRGKTSFGWISIANAGGEQVWAKV
eukprot:SAG22_NODE_1383_length_4542_cov_2.418636_2_plen_205_part_00